MGSKNVRARFQGIPPGRRLQLRRHFQFRNDTLWFTTEGNSRGEFAARRSLTMNESVLEKLKEGARRFHAEVHAEKREQYQRAAATPQKPHTLIIACADSRVDVESIRSSGPGEVL